MRTSSNSSFLWSSQGNWQTFRWNWKHLATIPHFSIVKANRCKQMRKFSSKFRFLWSSEGNRQTFRRNWKHPATTSHFEFFCRKKPTVANKCKNTKRIHLIILEMSVHLSRSFKSAKQWVFSRTFSFWHNRERSAWSWLQTVWLIWGFSCAGDE